MHKPDEQISLDIARRWKELGVIVLFLVLVAVIALVPMPGIRAAADTLLILVGLSLGASIWAVWNA
jgi:hypothetical protein